MSLSTPRTTRSAGQVTAGGLVWRGALAGVIAGLVAFVFARIFAEPVIDAAIGYESGRDDAQNALAVAMGQTPDPGGPDIFSRGVQSTIGIATGMVGIGLALGLFCAVAYALVHGRVGLRPRVLALVVAGAGFLTVYLTPFVKYPANPPAIGHDATIGPRAGLYLVMILGSLVFLAVAVAAARRLAPRLGAWNATLVAIVVYVVLAGILMALLPSLGELSSNVADYGPAVTETPQPLTDPAGHIVYPGFDADTLYDFRLYSITAQVLIWGLIGLILGGLVERLTGTERTSSTVDDRAEEPAAV